MNRDNPIPTDEQLAAYLSHRAAPAETAAVEAWLAADPAHVDELLDIAVAAALPTVRRRAVAPPWYRRPVYWAAAAVVAAVLVSVSLSWQRGAEPDSAPMVAEVAVRPEPAVLPEPVAAEQPAAAREVPQTGQALQRDERHAAAQSTVAVADPLLEVTFPRRQREVCPAGQDITFRYSSNAAQLTLTALDGEGNTLLRADVAGTEQYTLTAATIGEGSTLIWTLTATFAEGQSQRRTGTIEIR